MFSDLAIPVGLTGLTTSQPLSKAVAIGSHPADWAPNTFHSVSSTIPAATSSRHALSTLVRREPDAIGMTTWAGIRQPSCSAIRSEEHTSELQSRNDISYAVFC